MKAVSRGFDLGVVGCVGWVRSVPTSERAFGAFWSAVENGSRLGAACWGARTPARRSVRGVSAAGGGIVEEGEHSVDVEGQKRWLLL